jgi:tetratricopeptide (TPR) repeat protein
VRTLGTKRTGMLVALLLVALSLATWRQAAFWRSDLELWSHTLAVTSNNLIAEDNLGIALLHANRTDEAMEHFQNAERIEPTDAISRINLGADYQDQNRLAEAADEYAIAIANTEDPSLLATAYENLGRVYLREADYARAQSVYEHLLKSDPKNVNAFLGLGRAQAGKTASALAASLREQPSAPGYLQLGQLLEQLGDDERAAQAYRDALKIDPKLDQASDALKNLKSP